MHPQTVQEGQPLEGYSKGHGHHIMSSYGEESQELGGGSNVQPLMNGDERLNVVNTSILGSYIGEGSSGSSIIVAGATGAGSQPMKPTHRRKKSQQPTLMTTKQKQA